MARENLLDSARHKLRLAHYHADTLGSVLAQNPPDDVEDDLRIALEAHLEGMVYSGTAAAEKTLRSAAPEFFGQEESIQSMLRRGLARDALDAETTSFLRSFERWWVGRGRQARYAQAARDLRNDAAHAFYRKAPLGGRWRMSFRNGHARLDIGDFREGYLEELRLLEPLVAEAARLGAAASTS